MSANTSGTYFAKSSFLDGQQLREGMTDELEGTIDISRFGPAQVNQLFGCGKHKMAATVDVHVFFRKASGKCYSSMLKSRSVGSAGLRRWQCLLARLTISSGFGTAGHGPFVSFSRST